MTHLYLVSRFGDRAWRIYAATSDQAKRSYCKVMGFKASDPWCGVRSGTISARRLTPDEAADWESGAEDRRMAGAFIKGMLDICVKAREEQA